MYYQLGLHVVSIASRTLENTVGGQIPVMVSLLCRPRKQNESTLNYVTGSNIRESGAWCWVLVLLCIHIYTIAGTSIKETIKSFRSCSITTPNNHVVSEWVVLGWFRLLEWISGLSLGRLRTGPCWNVFHLALTRRLSRVLPVAIILRLRFCREFPSCELNRISITTP